ncbi:MULTISPECIES: DUF3108 domain-containing protein [Lysobacter]|uniref:DUF3108 domain-containing protein n=1 Tax=Lysobacter TaxID=68 RepID=UPI001F481887|nr:MULTISPECIES: DUF3108 domain-containing protein [Lysobacter]UJB17966.1 DUF3108 domain-containing protein [Lysobacter capsici]UJQ28311.1 DUF3108 domain-containing protein [Lysobacter gummosus]
MTTHLSTKIRFAALAFALAAVSAPAAAVKPFSADYQASYMGIQGAGRMSLAQADGNRWKYNLSISSPLAELQQSTTFDENGGQLRPLSGSDSSKVLTKKKTKNASYDWSRGVATWSGDVKPDRAGPIKLQSGDLDALLINLALVRDANAGKPMSYRMVEDGRTKQLTYTVVGKEAITIGGKSQQATKVSSKNGDKETIAWVVPGMPVPARILQRENGNDAIDLRVQAVR